VTSEQPDPQLMILAEVLGNLRDSLALVSLALKDHVADFPSPARDEVMMQVERHLARIREGQRGTFE
jgi:hypothetical protein